jgi:hypothetical protein
LRGAGAHIKAFSIPANQGVMTMTNVFQAQGQCQTKPRKGFSTSRINQPSMRVLALIASVSMLGLSGCAQTPTDHATNTSPSMAAHGMSKGSADGTMAQMDTQMKMMRETHNRMMQAKSSEERNALMASHMKQMQDGMAMMGGMGSGGMAGMQGHSPMTGDMSARQQMMEKRMDMMQSMMQMMMDRMPQAPSK